MRIIIHRSARRRQRNQSQRLVQHLQIPHLSTGDMLRHAIGQGTAVGLHAKQFIDHGQLVPDDISAAVGEPAARPARLHAAAACSTVFRGRWARPRRSTSCWPSAKRRSTASSNCTSTKNELVERLVARGGRRQAGSRSASGWKPIAVRPRPCADYYASDGLLESIEAMGTVEEVFSRLIEAVQRVAQPEVAARGVSG